MCGPPQGMDAGILEQGLQLLRSALAQPNDQASTQAPAHGRDTSDATSAQAGAPDLSAATTSWVQTQPEGTVPSPALALSFLHPQAGATGPAAPADAQVAPSAGGASICLHLSPELVAGLMGMLKQLLGSRGGPAQLPVGALERVAGLMGMLKQLLGGLGGAAQAPAGAEGGQEAAAPQTRSPRAGRGRCPGAAPAQ